MDEADRIGGALLAGEHRLALRVYYEDTDAGRVAYHASYLRFFERGRAEALRLLGVDQVALLQEAGLLFVVRRIEIDYLASALLDDLLTISTKAVRMGGASLDMLQEARRGESVLARARVVCVAVGREGRALRLPDALRLKLIAGFPALSDKPDPS